ncbi:MAG: fimbria/pilus periplasmic chaperone, partial [Steroidobacteraceae bacterium]|nr:fimbria/pilus periplasmic chaperone [Steroidobacteraceae bacterium]
IRNEGQHPLGFQIQAMEWTQNKDGQDQYSETADLVFYPKIVTIEPGRERVVRVGTRTPVVAVEKTYRLFIEELPTNVRQSGGAAAQISFLIRFGAPIFVAPVKAEDALKVGAITWSPGQLTVSASNAGNRHQAVTSIQLRGTDANGKEVFAKTLADRYLLAGVTKSYRAMVTVEECHATSVVEVEIKTDKASAKEQSRVTPAACAAR